MPGPEDTEVGSGDEALLPQGSLGRDIRCYMEDLAGKVSGEVAEMKIAWQRGVDKRLTRGT